jgi:hypothetical protein
VGLGRVPAIPHQGVPAPEGVGEPAPLPRLEPEPVPGSTTASTPTRSRNPSSRRRSRLRKPRSLTGASKNLERMARAAIIRPDEALRGEDTGTKYPTEEHQSMGE